MNPFGLSQSLVDAALQVHKEAMSPDANVKTVPTKKNDKDVNLRKREKEIAGSHKANVQKEETVAEALKGGQKKLDKNHNGKLDSDDFKKLRKEETVPFEGPYEKKGPAKTKNVAKNAARKAMKKVKTSMSKVKTGGAVREEVEQVDEISKKTAMSAYQSASFVDSEHPKQDAIRGHIERKWGKKMGQHADAHAHVSNYGRNEPGKRAGDSLHHQDKLTGFDKTKVGRISKSGTMNKQDQKYNASAIKKRLGTHTKPKLPEEVQFSPEELERIEAIVGTNK